MRILHIESGRKLYGGARQAGYLINGLAAAGVENILLCEPAHPLTEAAGVSRIVPFRSAGDLDFLFARRLSRIIREHSPDLVQVHSRRGADRYSGRAAARLGVPAVLTRRVQSREPVSHLCRMCRSYAAIVAISSVVEDELVAAGVSSENLYRIPSVVDGSLFQPDPEARSRLISRYRLANDVTTIGVASQLIRRKGIELLLAALPELVRACPKLTLLIFGQGPRRAGLERQVRKLGVQAQVRFCGQVRDWPALLPGLDLLVHPARREALGNVILEAMAAGVPVIARASGGIVDVLDHGKEGWLVRASAPSAWAQAIEDALASRDERERRAGAARCKVLSAYTIEAMTGNYLRLYRNVLERPR